MSNCQERLHAKFMVSCCKEANLPIVAQNQSNNRGRSCMQQANKIQMSSWESYSSKTHRGDVGYQKDKCCKSGGKLTWGKCSRKNGFDLSFLGNEIVPILLGLGETEKFSLVFWVVLWFMEISTHFLNKERSGEKSCCESLTCFYVSS